MEEKHRQQVANKAFSGVIWVFAEKFSSQIVSLIVAILLARILSPEDYGPTSIVTIFFSFFSVLITGGFNTALIQKKDADALDYSTCLVFSLITASLLYVVMFICAPLISQVYNQEILIPVFRVMSIMLLVDAVKAVLVAYISSKLLFRKFFVSSLVAICISAVIGIFLALKGYGVWALVAQQMVFSIVGTGVLLLISGCPISLRFSYRRLQSLGRFGWKVLATSVVGVVYEQINPVIIGIRFTATDLSYYTKGKGFPTLLNNTITGTLATVIFPVMSKFQDDRQQVLNATRKYINFSSFAVFPLMIGFFAVSENFVKVILTEKWLFAVPYIQIFCISYMFNILQTGNLEAIKAIGRSDVLLILEIIKKTLYFIIIFLFVLFTDSPIYLAVSSIFCTVIATVVNTFPNRKLLGYKYRLQIQDISKNLVTALLMGIIVYTMNNLLIDTFILLLLQIMVGIVVYMALGILFKNNNIVFLWNLLTKKIFEVQ